MNIPQEQKAGASETNNPPAPSEASKPTRYADWISYAVAVTQQASSGTSFSTNSEF
jgi:hypothetical protein